MKRQNGVPASYLRSAQAFSEAADRRSSTGYLNEPVPARRKLPLGFARRIYLRMTRGRTGLTSR